MVDMQCCPRSELRLFKVMSPKIVLPLAYPLITSNLSQEQLFFKTECFFVHVERILDNIRDVSIILFIYKRKKILIHKLHESWKGFPGLNQLIKILLLRMKNVTFLYRSRLNSVC